MNTKKDEKDRYKEQILHRSHFITVSVHTTEIKMSCQDELRTEENASSLALYVHWHPELEFFLCGKGRIGVLY